MQKITKKEFIEKCNILYNNKYDYSLVEFNTITSKIEIICPIHGKFIIPANQHICRLRGCPKCKKDIFKQKCIENFIKKAQSIHNNKYDYSKVDIKKFMDKAIIICPIHGEFIQRAWNHINNRNPQGCRQCFNEIHNITQNIFIKKAQDIHNNKYDYSNVEYTTLLNKVKIICPIHGEFEQRAGSHLYDKSGCPICKKINDALSNEQFLEKSKVLHGNKYDYSLVNYKNNHAKVKIICPIHGEFEQLAGVHLSGSGCPICKESKGEKIVKIFLDKYNIKYERQKNFNTCIRKKRKLLFDFYLYDYNILLEYDGKLHFQPWSKSENSLKIFKNHKKCDKFKNVWCVNNNIKLLRINYKQDIIKELEQQLLPLIV
jgi:hypothetical protein